MSQEKDRRWLIRTYAGHSTAKASNKLYRKNLAKGQTGLSVGRLGKETRVSLEKRENQSGNPRFATSLLTQQVLPTEYSVTLK